MKTEIETLELSLFAHWATYLINGDASGLEDGEQEEIDSYLATLPGWSCIDVSEDYSFRRSNDASNLGGDCADYKFIKM
jgi:hypothetical protein